MSTKSKPMFRKLGNAPLAQPTFTGWAKAPTPDHTDDTENNHTNIATTAYVTSAVVTGVTNGIAALDAVFATKVTGAASDESYSGGLFLNKNGTWATPTDASVPATSTGTPGQVCTINTAGTHLYYDNVQTLIGSGQISTAQLACGVMGDGDYEAGLVPAGSATHGSEFLRKDGTWVEPREALIEPFSATASNALPFNSQTYTLAEIEQPIQTVVHSTTHGMLKTAPGQTPTSNQWNSLVSSDGTARMATSINVRSAHSKVRLVTSLSARIDRVMVGLRFLRTIDGTDTVVAGSEQFGRSSDLVGDDHHTYTVECIDAALPAALAANSSRTYPFTVNYQVQMTWNHPTLETGYVEFNWDPAAGTGSNNSSIIMTELHPVCAIVRN